ncbi:hypothetical protein [Anaeropeptidivorans aminofermentans]|uniref:hypothetical protein n=1 Tax=Anaeropeptidivorans aminofermentans TaxID=2934315 RepID=UPI002024AA9D|nr:hypothetical protein [Anaeropeptidivorans aminofermentans]MBE6012881.1 hypothetical protein [Lachnospiraceae bacterium]
MFLGIMPFSDFIFAAIIAFFLTWAYVSISGFMEKLKERGIEDQYPINELEQILNRCYALFPLEQISFDGSMFRRGMYIRIRTIQNKTFEGRFLGTNNDNMICLMTKKFIIAHAIQNIEEMEKID